MLREQFEEVERRIKEACLRSGRNRDEITLIAVSKTQPIERLKEAYDFGTRVFGENKVQEILDKHEQLPDDIKWHMIGHLQRNKIKYIIDKAALIHSVDSLRLAEAIDKEAEKHNVTAHILAEVNIAGEESKFGLRTEEVKPFMREMSRFQNICLHGLMTIAPYVEKPEENRTYFADLHKLFVDIANENIDNVNMSILSMGMTNDYEIAIEEGATMIRVGTGLFGARNYAHKEQNVR